MTIDSAVVRDEILGHLSKSWPDREYVDLDWDHGPIKERLPLFKVRRLAPLGPGQSWIYFSVGAFDAPTGAPHEFYIQAPSESWSHVETLALVSHFHSFSEHALSAGSIVDIGRPWAEGSSFHHLLVSWPHSLDVRVGSCATGVGDLVFLWLVGISEAEARFARERGVEALEDLLEESQVNLLDPVRVSVA